MVLFANTAWYLYNFRLPLARALRDRGLEPLFVAPPDQYVDSLRAEGFRFEPLRLGRASTNPFSELLTLVRLTRLYRRERPVVVHHFTIKCVLYGSLAAIISRTAIVINAITGLGHVFVSQRFKARVLRPVVKRLYRVVLSARQVHVIFQNNDDREAFAKLGLTNPARCYLIRGSGVDAQRFSPSGVTSPEPQRVLLVGRLLAEKGIREFVDAARALRARGSTAIFEVAGELDAGNPSSVSREQLAAWKSEGVVNFKGHVDDIEPLLATATLVTLPSYREGVPRSLLEAAAMGKPLVATDVPGCREIVEDGVNGLLVPPRDARALGDAIERLLMNPGLSTRMGIASRQKVLDAFDEKTVITATLRVYAELGAFEPVVNAGPLPRRN